MDHSPTTALIRIPAKAALFGIGYAALAALGRLLSPDPSLFVAFWFPGGLYLTVLLRNETRSWPALVAAACVANFAFDLANGQPPLLSVFFFAGNTMDAIVGALLLRRLLPRPYGLAGVREAVLMIVFGGLATTVLSATTGSAALALIAGRAFSLHSWALWWAGTAFGILIVAPLLLAWTAADSQRLLGRRAAEVCALLLSTGVLSWLIAGHETGGGVDGKVLLVPLLFWAVLRHGARGTSASILVIAVVFALRIARWPATVEADAPLLSIQLYLLVMVCVSMLIAASVEVRRKLTADLALTAGARADAQAGSFILDGDRRLVSAKGTFLRMLGLEGFERQSHVPASALFHSAAAETTVSADPEGTGKSIREAAMRGPDGSAVDSSIAVSALRDDAGGLRHVGDAMEVSDRTSGERRFHTLVVEMSELVVLHEIVRDESGRAVDYRILDCNPAFTTATGIPRELAVGALASLLYNAGAPPYLDAYARAVDTGEPARFETFFEPMGKHFAIVAYRTAPGQFTTVSTDVTHRVEREQEVARISRLYAVLSQVNQAVVRIRSPEDLFATVCRVAVEYGRFRAASISWKTPGGELRQRALRGTCLRSEGGRCPAQIEGAAEETMLTGQTVLRGRPGAGTHAHGGSAAALPIECAYAGRGVLCVCADESGFFRREEIALLEETATDVAFALDNFEREAARRAAEDRLRESEERLRLAVETVGIGYTDWEVGTHEVRYGGAYDRILGVSLQDINGDPAHALDFVAPGDRGLVAGSYETLQAGQPVSDLQYRLVRPSGEVRWVRSQIRPIADSEGRVVRIVGVTQDITPRKQARERLSQSEERFRALVEAAPDGIFVQVDERIVYTNAAAVRILGAESAAQVVEAPLFDLFHHENHAAIRERMRIVREEHRPAPAQDQRYIRFDGTTIDVEVSAVPITFEERPASLVFFHDTTRRKQLERQLIHAQKTEAIGQLAGGVAHDFNNLLTVILVRAGLLLETTRHDEQMQQALRDIELQAKRATDLTRQLLSFSRKSAMKIAPTDVNTLLLGLHRMLKRVIGEHIPLRLRCAEALPHIEADAGMIEQVVTNLCVNARDAMPNGGEISLATDIFVVDASSAAPPEAPPGTYVSIEVRDTGHGMSEDVLAHIFEPFFTTKEPGKGTGLGLATAHGIVAHHGGWIEVESVAGRGSVFRVLLPASEKSVEAEISPDGSTVLRGTETVLLVEDEDNVRKLTSLALRRYGYNVLEAANGRAAMEIWRTRAADVDLLLTDLVMPEGMTGQQLAERLRAQKPSLRVLISSGYSKGTLFREGLPDIDYLPKPYRAEALAAAVRACLDRPRI